MLEFCYNGSYYEEIDFKNDFLTKNLDKVIETIDYDSKKVYSHVNPSFSEEYVNYRVSNECLIEIAEQGDRPVATLDCSLMKFNNINFPIVAQIISSIFAGKIKEFGVSGRIWYPKNGFMGWHTNSNNKGHRLYCVYVKEGGKSFFRYKNPINGEIVTSWDKKGWNFRIFRIDKKLLWHTIYSGTDRFSIGYALYF